MFNTVAIVSAPARPSPGLTKSWGCSALFHGPCGLGVWTGRRPSLLHGPLEEAGAVSNSRGGSSLLSGRSLDLGCFLMLRRVFGHVGLRLYIYI